MRSLLPMLVLLAGCGAPTAVPVANEGTAVAPAGLTVIPGALPGRDTEIDRVADRCSRPLMCGEIGYLDCGSAADGPAYYFDRRSGKILGTCGGACMIDPDGRCRRECPPPGWTCRR